MVAAAQKTSLKPSVATVQETAVEHFTFSETLVSVKVHNGGSRGVTEAPFGNIIRSTGDAADDNPFRFSTRYYDQETGLYAYPKRYYDPELGRWLSRDPAEELGGDNLYAFVLNDPIGLVDPFGLADDRFAGLHQSQFVLPRSVRVIRRKKIGVALADGVIRPGQTGTPGLGLVDAYVAATCILEVNAVPDVVQ